MLNSVVMKNHSLLHFLPPLLKEVLFFRMKRDLVIKVLIEDHLTGVYSYFKVFLDLFLMAAVDVCRVRTADIAVIILQSPEVNESFYALPFDWLF